jgi:hypothetical protein
MRDRIEELIWERRDGQISPQDGEWLESRLAEDPGARAQAENAAFLSQLLEQDSAEVRPPPELRPRIQAALAGVRRGRPSSMLASWREMLLLRSPRFANLSVGLVGLLCLIVGGAAVQLVHVVRGQGPIPEQEVYGTMRPSAAGGVDLELAAGAGRLSLRRVGSTLELEADLPALGPDEILIRGAALRTRSLASPASGGVRLEASEREVALHQLGTGRYRVALEVAEAEATLEITASAQGKPLLRRELRWSDL